MVSWVYVLHSPSLDRYYVGSTSLPANERLARHNQGYYDNKWSASGVPWMVFLEIQCTSLSTAKAIESHIKRMKSRRYIENLRRYPEMIEKLLSQYTQPDC